MTLTRKRKIEILAGVLLLAGAAAFCLIRAGQRPRAGVIESAPYTCAWTREKKGQMRIEITGELPENSEWSIMANSGVIEVSQSADAPIFTVKAVNEGIGILSLNMRDTAVSIEKGADFKLYFTVDGRKRISMDSFTATELKADCFEGENGETLHWRKGEAGSLFLSLTGTDWRVESADGVIFYGPTVDGDTVRLEVLADKDAQAKSLVLIDNETDLGFELRFTRKDGALDIAECRSAKAAEPEPKEPNEDAEALDIIRESAETDEEKNRLIARYWDEQRKKNAEAYAAYAEARAQEAETDGESGSRDKG